MQTNFQRVQAAIAEALCINPDDINPDTRLIADLGMESIDFLDVAFRIEKEFGISIPRGEIERQARGDLRDEEFAVDGILTAVAVERLRRLMPEVPASAFAQKIHLRDIPALFTVQSFVNIVERQLASLQMPAPESGQVGTAQMG